MWVKLPQQPPRLHVFFSTPKATAMHSLVDLPTEILLNIVESLDLTSAASNTTLAHLCRTCRTLQDVVQATLYSFVHLASSEDRNFKRLTCFLRTISAKSHLIKEVKWLYLDTDYAPTASMLTGTALTKLLDPTNFAQSQDWLPSEQEKPRFQELAKRLLSMLSDVEHLTLVVKNRHPRDLLFHITHQRAIGKPVLTKLRTFRVIKENNPQAFALADYIDIMTLPAIEEMRLDIRLESGFIWPHSHNVITHTNIELYSASLDYSDLVRLLEVCDSLKSFTFRNQGLRALGMHVSYGRGAHPPFPPRSLVTMLLNTHGGTLENYTANFMGHAEREYYGWFNGHDHTYPSFNLFSNLKWLSIDMSAIQGLKLFPSTLEHLRINARSENLDRNFLQEIQKLEIPSPNIKEVILNVASWASHEEQETQQILEGFDTESSLCYFVNGVIRTCTSPSPHTFQVFTFLGTPYILQARYFIWDDYNSDLGAEIVMEEKLSRDGPMSEIPAQD